MDMKWVFWVHVSADMGMKWVFWVHVSADVGMKGRFWVHMRVEKWMISTIVLMLGRIWFFCGFQQGCVHVCLGEKVNTARCTRSIADPHSPALRFGDLRHAFE